MDRLSGFVSLDSFHIGEGTLRMTAVMVGLLIKWFKSLNPSSSFLSV